MADSLAPAEVEPLLRGRFGRPYLYAERCASTQRLLPDEAAEGAVAATEEQVEGRGRLGRRWDAPARSSVLMSVVLRPAVESNRLPALSLVAGRAVAAAIAAETGLAPGVKFPNDVLVAGRKVAGILAEANASRVVLGIGVNANQVNSELPAGAMSLRVAMGKQVDRARLLAAILDSLEREYDAWLSASAASG